MIGFLLGIASSIVAAVLIAGALAAKARMPFRALRLSLRVAPRMSSTGVTNFFASREDYVRHRKERTITDYMATAREELQYVGFWLAQAAELEELTVELRKLLDRGVRVRLTLLDPEIDDETQEAIAGALGLTNNGLRDRARNAWEELVRFQGELPRDAAANLELAQHSEWLTASAFLFDRGRPFAKTLIDVKLYGMGRQRSFGMELRPPRRGTEDSLYETVTQSFLIVASRARRWH